MSIAELLQKYPLKRIKPVDGMAVTAGIWEEAHEYHRQTHGLHAVFSHGPGIVTGLEVIASDPPDTSVYILPGIALDPAGRTIVLSQPVSYDIGDEMAGQLYLLLSYGESQPRSKNGDEPAETPLYLNTEFSITAQTALPKTPHVELARVWRDSQGSVFLNARDFALPGPNEINLRFRREVGAAREASLAVTYLGKVKHKKHGAGASYLAQTLNHLGHCRLFVEDDVPLGPGIVAHTLSYLIGQGKFELDKDQINGLRNYVHKGKGTLLIESIDAAAEASFLNFLKTAKMLPQKLPAGHPLLTRPYFFVTPPAGFEPEGKLLVEEGVILSTYNYGLLWQGERRDQEASREEIRAATEWGRNIVTYAIDRRRMNSQ